MTEQMWGAARTLGRRLRGLFDAPLASDATPLELLQAALDELEAKVQPSGRGGRVFPYTRLAIHVAQPSADPAAIRAVFGHLEARLRERLAEIRCAAPAVLDVSVHVASDGDRILRIECDGGVPGKVPAPGSIPELRLHVAKGLTDATDYTFTGGAVAIGRGAAPADALGRVRRNDVAFGDGRDGVSETVARAHARIAFDSTLGAYLLFNESTTNPTFLLRAGRSLRVAPRDPRGVRLVSGDAVQLGRAVVEIAVIDSPH